MCSTAVSLDGMVSISTFNKGGASKAFSKVEDGSPVTVLKNSEPAFLILNVHDYKQLVEAKKKLEAFEARQEAEAGEGKVFDSIDALLEDLNA